MTLLNKIYWPLMLSMVLLYCGCVQQTHPKAITFKVDMNTFEEFDSVGLRGSFTSPPWEVTLPMTDDNKDGVYEITITKKTAQNTIEFKYVIDNTLFELEGSHNRVINFEYRPQQLVYSALFDNNKGIQDTVNN